MKLDDIEKEKQGAREGRRGKECRLIKGRESLTDREWGLKYGGSIKGVGKRERGRERERERERESRVREREQGRAGIT